MSSRRPFVAANWKMHKGVAEAEQFCAGLLPRVADPVAEVAICPSFLALRRVVELCEPTPVIAAAQNLHFEPEGAFTGEVSAAMVAETGAKGVVVGHSERRQLFGETDEAVSRKVEAALGAGLLPIFCCGETEEERDDERTESVLRRQIEAGLSRVDRAHLADLVIAYEPVWAIGTGRTATPDQAEGAIGSIRSMVAERDPDAAARVRILYGGSVKPDNAGELLGREEIDGALVGGASLEPDAFAAIVAAA